MAMWSLCEVRFSVDVKKKKNYDTRFVICYYFFDL